MVQVNNQVSLTPENLSPYTWFEYNRMLYLAIRWGSYPNDKLNKPKLLAVCFDPDLNVEAEFFPCGIKVNVVPDSKLSVFYKIDSRTEIGA